jgi:hypothetical protein
MKNRLMKEQNEKLTFFFFKESLCHYLFLDVLTFCSTGSGYIEIHTGSEKLLEPASSCERLPTELGF